MLFAFAAGAWGQSISVTAPAANQTVSGSSFTATVSISSAPNACIVEYLINGESIGFSRIEQTPDFAITFNPYDIGNGQEHHIQALLMDCFQNTLATSSAVEFTILNTNAVNSQMTVSCTTSDTSMWSGIVECLAAQSGSPAGLLYSCFIDGIPVGRDDSHHTCSFPTASFANGNHSVLINATANNADNQAMVYTVWEQQIVFSNAASPSYLRVNSREAYLSTSGTLQTAAPAIVNADGSTTSISSVSYYAQPANSSSNTACSVNASGLITGSAFGLCDEWILSTSPAMASGTISAAGLAANASTVFFNLSGCPSSLHPPLPFIALIDSGSNTEAVLVTDMDCNSSPNPGFIAMVRGYLGTAAIAHAGDVLWVIPFQREVFAYVEPSNAILNWTTAGTIVSNWSPNSFWFMSCFTCGSGNFFASQFEPILSQNLSVLSPMLNQAFSAMEDAIYPSGCNPGTPPCDTQANFESQITAYYNTTLPGWLHAGGAKLYENFSWGFFNSQTAMYASVEYPGGASGPWTTPSVTYAVQAAASSGLALGMWGPDEVSSFYGATPHPCVVLGGGTGCPTQISGNGTTATVSWSPPLLPFTYQGKFAIFGATTNSSLNCSVSVPACPTSGAANSMYTASGITGGITFPSSFNGTATSSTDPGLSIELWLGTMWPGGTPGYLPHTAWTTFRSQMQSASPSLLFSAPPIAQGLPFVMNAWDGGSYGDYARIYSDCTSASYTPLHQSTISVANCLVNGTNGVNALGAASGVRGNWAALLNNKLLVPLTGSFTNAYFPVNDLGAGIAITSITNQTVTFASPHGIYNVLPGVTRMTISGSSNSYYNTFWIIDSCPTATTCTISRRFPNTTAGTTTGTFTLNFPDTSTQTISSITASTTLQDSNVFSYPSTPTCAQRNERGHFFTLSGTGLPSYYTGGQQFLFAAESANCTGNLTGPNLWREVPTNQSGTGGTAFTMTDNNWHNGTTSAMGTNPVIEGARGVFTSILATVVAGAGAGANWPPGSNPVNYGTNGVPNGSVVCNTYNPPFVDSDCSGGRFSGGHPVWEDGTGQTTEWHALVTANQLLSNPHVTKCLFQPRAAAPDLGFGLETSVRQGSNSNCLMALNKTDAPVTVAPSLAPYQTGQSFIQIVSDWQQPQFVSLSAAPSSAMVTIPPGGVAFWIAPHAADLLLQPIIAANLADVAGASSIAVEYSCSNYPFTQQTGSLPLVANAGSGLVTLPIDKNTCGTVTYRLRYLGGNGAPLATSSQQTL